ncbi:MAG: site-specific integrase [Lachnospiraceae bacterium]|nr:site-specific integrase [Lachnospiraceae bacterium]
MPRRGDNIRKRTDGRWEGRYPAISEDGKKRYLSVYGKSYNEVKEKLTARMYMLNRDDSHRVQPSQKSGRLPQQICNASFCVLMEEWLEEVAQNRKYSTYIKYKKLYTCHIKALFFSDNLSQMTNSHIQAEMAKLEVSDSTRQSVLATVKQTLCYIEKQYGYPVPTIAGCALQKRAASIEIMDRAEQTRLIRFLHSDMDISKAGIYLCLFTGLRLGEICSLKWEDIDRERGLLHVNRTVQRIESREGTTKTILLETPPKSVFSKRAIPISDTLLSLLTNFHQEGQEYVLKKNRPMEPRTYQNHFKKYLEGIDAPNYNFHILRHTFATNCIDSGMDVKSLSEILGHSNVQITMNRYVHPSMDTKRKHINALSANYGQLCGQM